MENKFLQDVQKVYDYLSDKKKEVNKLYEFLEKNQFEKLEIIDVMAKKLELEMSDDPPWEIKGKGIPVKGRIPTAAPIFSKIWKTIIIIRPVEIKV